MFSTTLFKESYSTNLLFFFSFQSIYSIFFCIHFLECIIYLFFLPKNPAVTQNVFELLINISHSLNKLQS